MAPEKMLVYTEDGRAQWVDKSEVPAAPASANPPQPEADGGVGPRPQSPAGHVGAVDRAAAEEDNQKKRKFGRK